MLAEEECSLILKKFTCTGENKSQVWTLQSYGSNAGQNQAIAFVNLLQKFMK